LRDVKKTGDEEQEGEKRGKRRRVQLVMLGFFHRRLAKLEREARHQKHGSKEGA